MFDNEEKKIYAFVRTQMGILIGKDLKYNYSQN